MDKFMIILVSIVLLSINVWTAEATHAKERVYYVYGDPMPGTKFRQKLFSSAIPLDKPYSKLSKKHQAIVRSDYEGMPETETPPFPAKGYGALIEPLVKAHSKIGRRGKLAVIAVVGSDGAVKKVEVLSTPSKSMSEFASVLLFNTPFDPATCNAAPCSMEYLLLIDTATSYKSF